jgi:hypothetical protein
MNPGEHRESYQTKAELAKEIEILKSLLAQHLARIENLERKLQVQSSAPPKPIEAEPEPDEPGELDPDEEEALKKATQ